LSHDITRQRIKRLSQTINIYLVVWSCASSFCSGPKRQQSVY